MATRLRIDGVDVTLTGRTFACPDDKDLEAALNRWAALPAGIDAPSGTPEGKLRAAAEADWGAVIVSYTTEGVKDDAEY